jgi:hypothetical protein
MQGITGFGSFPNGFSGKMITAQELVSAAIEVHQLNPETQTVGVASLRRQTLRERNENRDYLNNVNLLLLGRQH